MAEYLLFSHGILDQKIMPDLLGQSGVDLLVSAVSLAENGQVPAPQASCAL